MAIAFGLVAKSGFRVKENIHVAVGAERLHLEAPEEVKNYTLLAFVFCL